MQHEQLPPLGSENLSISILAESVRRRKPLNSICHRTGATRSCKGMVDERRHSPVKVP